MQFSPPNKEAAARPRRTAHSPEAVLTIAEVAEWLAVSVRSVERLDIPFVFLGSRQKRYVGKDVLAYLDQRKSA